MLQVNATSILLRGDLVKRENGNVDIFSVPVSAGTDGPSIPEPVVQPLPTAAFNTSPIAAS